MTSRHPYRERHIRNNPRRNEAHIKSVIYVESFPRSTLPDLPIRKEMMNTAMLNKRTPTTITIGDLLTVLPHVNMPII